MKVEKIRLTDEVKENFNKRYVQSKQVPITGTHANEDGDTVALRSYYQPTVPERFGKWISSVISKFSRK